MEPSGCLESGVHHGRAAEDVVLPHDDTPAVNPDASYHTSLVVPPAELQKEASTTHTQTSPVLKVAQHPHGNVCVSGVTSKTF